MASIELTASEQSIVRLVKTNPRLTTSELKGKVTMRGFEQTLIFLERIGKLERILGQHNRREWVINEKGEADAIQQPQSTIIATQVKRPVKAQAYNYLIVYASYDDNKGKGEGNMEMKLNHRLTSIAGVRQVEKELVKIHSKNDPSINRCVLRNFKLLNVVKEFEKNSEETKS